MTGADEGSGLPVILVIVGGAGNSVTTIRQGLSQERSETNSGMFVPTSDRAGFIPRRRWNGASSEHVPSR